MNTGVYVYIDPRSTMRYLDTYICIYIYIHVHSVLIVHLWVILLIQFVSNGIWFQCWKMLKCLFLLTRNWASPCRCWMTARRWIVAPPRRFWRIFLTTVGCLLGGRFGRLNMYPNRYIDVYASIRYIYIYTYIYVYIYTCFAYWNGLRTQA